MKKILSILIISILTASAIFAKPVNEDADYYEDAVTDSNVSVDDEKAPFFTFKTSSSMRDITGKEISFSTLNVINKLKITEGVITYNTKKETFGFGSSYLAAYYILTMDEKNRTVLQNAYNNYLSDFKNKRLNRKDRKSISQYGKMSVHLNWGTIKASTPSNGIAKATLGYKFYDNSPYFVIQVPVTFNEFSTVNEGVSIESIPLTYAFTKAQMETLLEAISDKELSKLIPSKYIPIEEADVYDDSEAETEAVEEKTETEEEDLSVISE